MLFKKIKQKSLPNLFASASSLLLKCERRILVVYLRLCFIIDIISVPLKLGRVKY